MMIVRESTDTTVNDEVDEMKRKPFKININQQARDLTYSSRTCNSQASL
jgi:hypothetical protein